jgi:hypothetical protein
MISMKVKLFREGLVPVYRTDVNSEWMRIKNNILPNAIVPVRLFRGKERMDSKLVLGICFRRVVNIILLLHIRGRINKIEYLYNHFLRNSIINYFVGMRHLGRVIERGR